MMYGPVVLTCSRVCGATLLPVEQTLYVQMFVKIVIAILIQRVTKYLVVGLVQLVNREKFQLEDRLAKHHIMIVYLQYTQYESSSLKTLRYYIKKQKYLNSLIIS